jgi:hypothetical protein
VAEPKRLLASTTDRKNGPGLLSPPAGRGMLVQPQQAATVCELDLVQHAIRSMETGSDFGSKPAAGELPFNP